MKTSYCNQKNRALTLLEVLVVLFSLCVLAATLLAAVSAPRLRVALGCVNQLKQTGVALRTWQGENGDRLPWVSGATNFVGVRGQGVAEAIFQCLSNHLSGPKCLVCPADKARRPAASFAEALTSSNISYFVNLDAKEANPQDILSGDDNLEIRGARLKSGVAKIPGGGRLAWTPERHHGTGNLMLADGSVQRGDPHALASLAETNLAIP